MKLAWKWPLIIAAELRSRQTQTIFSEKCGRELLCRPHGSKTTASLERSQFPDLRNWLLSFFAHAADILSFLNSYFVFSDLPE
jgi:hypothetical protein